MTPLRPDDVTCPHCHALNHGESTRCFLCDQPLAGPSSAPAAKKDVPANRVGRVLPSFHLATLMLIIALVAVFLGVLHEAPMLAVLMVLPGSIALVRSLTLSAERYGRPPTTWDRAWAFFKAFGLVVAVMVSSVVAFFATCLSIMSTNPGRYGGPNAGTGFVCGIIAAIAVPIAVIAFLIRRRINRLRGDSLSGRPS